MWSRVLACMLLPAVCLGQAPSLPFRHIGYEQGLSNSTIECIFQDSRGFIWIGTRDGLDRYDGSEMTVYRNRGGDTLSLSDDYVRSIAEDGTHRLWVGTSNGLNCFDGGAFRRYAIGAVNAVCVDARGAVWAGTEGGLYGMAGTRGAGATGGAGGFSPAGLAGMHVYALLAGGDGELWIGCEKGLLRWGAAEPVAAIPPVTSIRADPSGDLWLGTEGDGLWVYHGGSNPGVHAYRHIDKDPSSLGGNMIRSVLVDREGRLWVGCINGGLNLFEASREKFFHYQNDPLDPTSLSQRTVSALFEDNQGNLWVGTHRGGLDLYMPGATKFRRSGAGLTNKDVRAFYEDARGNIWIGTDGGGLNRWDPRTDRWEAYRYDPYKSVGLSSDAVLDIREDRHGRCWVSTWEGGLDWFHPETGTFTRYVHRAGDTSSISSNYVQQTFEDRKGRLWVATYFGGLDLMDPATGTFQRVLGDATGETRVYGNNIVSLGEDAQGNVWAGTDDGGLNRCDLRTGRWSHYFTHEGKAPDIRVIFTDHRGRLWIGQAGLFLYDPVRDTFTCYTDKGGLSHEFIKGITEDGLGNFWISTGGGLTWFNPDTYDVMSYQRGEEFEAGAYLQTRAGEMLFGGTNGFNAFFPRDIQRNPYIPPVYITGFQVSGKPFGVRDTLRLTYRQSTFSFTFTALNYSAPENNQYAYMLEGFDHDWHYIGGEHKAGYTNLDPGTYTFRVKASNNDGVWNEQGARLLIVIAPPFWKTLWFGSLVLLAVAGGAYGFYRFKRNLELERMEERKREEIHQVQLQFFTNISHELRTPLTLILGQVEKLFKTDASPTLRHYYASIRRNAGRLMGLINELMDFRKLETGTLTLHVMPGRMDLFLEEIAGEFRDWAGEKNIRFSVDTTGFSPGAPAAAWFDRQVLEKIVLNLLHNAFKYTDAGGAIVLQALTSLEGFAPSFANELLVKNEYRGKRYCYLRVADTGIGISRESIQHLFERYYRISESHLGSGVGLAFVRSLTQLHKGDIFVYSERYRGTEIIVGIPCGEEDYTAAERWVAGAAGRVQLESIRAEVPEEPGPPRLDEAALSREAVYEAPLILIVEDNAELREFLADTFQPAYRVTTAVDGEDGWASIQSSPPDLIVSDVMMPRMDGVTLCRLVKQDLTTSHIPFLMLTAKNDAQLEGVESGADHYFTKPLSMDVLLATVRNVFHRQQRLRERYQRDYQVQARELVHSQKDKAFMDALLETVEAQMVNPELDVDYLCGQLGMSRTRLYQKIRQVTGQSIGEFVRTARLKRAVHILLHEDVPFTEVMYRVGIQSQSYFTKAFKKEFGKTPTQFLQEARR